LHTLKHRVAHVISAAAIVTFGLGVALIAPAHGATSGTLTLTRAVVAPGGGEDVSGGGCVARVSVQVEFDNAVVVTTRSSATGQYSAHLVVPTRVANGPHTIAVVCARPGGGTLSASEGVTVGLPNTGFQSGATIDVGAAFAACGTVLLMATRARRHAR
jgi:hypothetical protein